MIPKQIAPEPDGRTTDRLDLERSRRYSCIHRHFPHAESIRKHDCAGPMSENR